MKVFRGLFACALFSLITLSQSVKAGILLEPYLGYVTGQQKQTGTANLSGTEFGARVGYTLLNFGIGAEYVGASYTDDSSPKNNLTIGDIGVFVSYKLPVLFRVYATYVPSAAVKDKVSNSEFTFKGNSAKLGVGYTGLPFININLEYINATYKDVEIAGSTLSLDTKSTTSAYAISISAPFNLF